jgi:hypothetical protein
MGDGMSFVTRVYELVVSVDEGFLNGPIDDADEIEASRNECWEQIEKDIQLSARDLYGSERYRAIKIWRPILIENEEVEHE